MPREQIQFRDYDGDTTAVGAPVTHLSWVVPYCVQVALEINPKWLEGALKEHEKFAPADGKLLLYSEVMDRAEINHLIRLLRQARDKALGSDA